MVQMNLFSKQKWSHRSEKQTMIAKGERGGEINWENGIDMNILL